MRTKTEQNGVADKHVKEIKRKTRRHISVEEKTRIVLGRLRGEGIEGEARVISSIARQAIATKSAKKGAWRRCSGPLTKAGYTSAIFISEPTKTKPLQSGGIYIHPHLTAPPIDWSGKWESTFWLFCATFSVGC